MIAENVGSGGIERLVQRTLLWAINSDASGRFLCSSDKRIPAGERVAGKIRSGEKEIDLVCYPRTDTASSWANWELISVSEIPKALSAMCVGFVEIKPLHPEGFLSYGPRRGAVAIDGDVRQLRAAQKVSAESGHPAKEIYQLILIEACYPLAAQVQGAVIKDGPQEVTRCEEVFWRNTTTLNSQMIVGEVWLLKDEPYPSDPRRKITLKAILVDARETTSP